VSGVSGGVGNDEWGGDGNGEEGGRERGAV